MSHVLGIHLIITDLTQRNFSISDFLGNGSYIGVKEVDIIQITENTFIQKIKTKDNKENTSYLTSKSNFE